MERILKNILKVAAVVLFFVSLIVNAWLGYQLYEVMQVYNVQHGDSKVLDFTNMFVKDVLMANKDIDFDTRLNLEASVRALNDRQIFNQWQNFTKAETKEDSSSQAKLLLALLVNKIQH